MGSSFPVYYRINERDQITFVGGGWEAFARDNEGTALTAKQILGRSLWEFISGSTVIHLYRCLLEKVHLGQTITYPFRCDSPTYRRVLEMTVSLVDDNEAEFTTRPLSIKERTPVALLNVRVPRSEQLLCMCSWCNRIHVAQENWQEIEEAVEYFQLFEEKEVPRLTHGMCEACFKTMMKRV